MKPVVDVALEGHHASRTSQNHQKHRSNQAQNQMDLKKYGARYHGLADNRANISKPPCVARVLSQPARGLVVAPPLRRAVYGI
jgi:hypothetical protein